uniref:HMG box domain-containing protein n=1 Tax=Culex tarsalis TaxID=7177 RepID=A0A1Q3EZN9_CULTA
MAPRKHNKNRQPKGPYYFFMMEYKKKKEAEGYTFRGGSFELQSKASPHWNKMTMEEREPYQKMAQQHREFLRQNGERYTSQGIPLSVVEAEQKAKEMKADTIKNTISGMLDAGVASNELEKVEFFFISFAYFVVTSNGTYIPAEMGLVRYSLRDGVKDRLHMFIDPGKLPLGFSYDAKVHSESDHQLPIPPDAMGEKDNDEIVLRLFNFLSQGEKMPPLFTETTEIKMVENILKGILTQANMDENTLLVCPLSELFYQLKRATESFGMDIKTFPSVHIAQAIIQKDVYEYTKDIACDFHEEKGNGKYCPLSKCVRWAFIISDSCCLDLSIEMKPGRHLPLNADTALCNTTEIGDTSSYISTQFDNCSFVSSSEVTHLTNPMMSKLPKGHYEKYDDARMKDRYLSGRPSSSTAGSSYGDYDKRVKVKDEYPALNDSMASTSSKSRDSRNPWGGASSSSSSYRRDYSPSRSSRDRRDYSPSRSSRERRDRDYDRDRFRRDSPDRRRDERSTSSTSSSRRDRSDRSDRYRGRDSPEYNRGGRGSPDYTRGGSRIKQERRSPDPSDRPSTSSSRSSELPRTGGYGRGSLVAPPEPPRSPPGSDAFSSTDFPELGAVRSAGRGQLSK